MNPRATGISLLAAIAVAGCSKEPAPQTRTETLLVCEVKSASMVAGLGGAYTTSFVITKLDDKVVKVKGENREFTLDRLPVQQEGRGPLYRQLIVQPEKLVLRTENTDSKKTVEALIFNTGKYEDAFPFGWAEGQCKVSEKAF